MKCNIYPVLVYLDIELWRIERLDTYTQNPYPIPCNKEFYIIKYGTIDLCE